MSTFSKKNNFLKKRLKRVNRNLSSIDGNIQSLSIGVEKSLERLPEDNAAEVKAKAPEVKAKAPVEKKRRGVLTRLRAKQIEPSQKDIDKMYPNFRNTSGTEENISGTEGEQDDILNDRFAGYLSSDFQSVRPLRHQRRVQRNKAIIMIVLVAIVLYWLLSLLFSG